MVSSLTGGGREALQRAISSTRGAVDDLNDAIAHAGMLDRDDEHVALGVQGALGQAREAVRNIATARDDEAAVYHARFGADRSSLGAQVLEIHRASLAEAVADLAALERKAVDANAPMLHPARYLGRHGLEARLTDVRERFDVDADLLASFRADVH